MNSPLSINPGYTSMIVRTCLLLAALLMALPSISYSATVLPVSLERMSERAALIFHGRVIGQEVKTDDSNLIATHTTFEVLEQIKGDAGDEYTIKQIGGEMSGRRIAMRTVGIPQFELGKDYIVFLPNASRLGFQSPIGLSQGRFTITEQDGDTIVSNGRSVASLLNAQQSRQQNMLTGTDLAASRAQIPGEHHLEHVSGKPAYADKQAFIDLVKRMSVAK